MHHFVFLLLLFFSISLEADAQNLAFSYKGPADPTQISVSAGGTIPFPDTSAGSTGSVLFFIKNTGTSTVQITGISSSNPLFAVSASSISVAAGQTASVTLAFSPKVSGVTASSITITTNDGSAYPFALTGTGVAPVYVISYVLNPDGNQIQVSNGGTVAFPATLVSQTTSATVTITNKGTGKGTANAASISGAAFKITGLPLLPATLDPAASIKFTVLFAPVQSGVSQGNLQITLDSVATSIALTGQGSAAAYSYSVVTASSSTALAPNGTISFAGTNVNATSTLTVQIQNTGNSAGTITSVVIVGTNFTLPSLSPLPWTLAPGASASFNVAFSPTTPGSQTAKLLIDSTSFTLSGTGLGAQLTLAFTVGSSTSTIAPGGTANFPNTVVGSTAAGTVVIQNTGNLSANVNSIALAGQSFGATIPPLPAAIAAGDSFPIPVSFLPNALGSLTGTLAIDNLTINLRGIGTAPPVLPSYSFTGVGSAASAATQPTIGLTLAAPYASDITGTLTLSFASGSFVNDPALQFSTGGLTTPFVIKANTTTALFGSATSVQFQTGTVAGTITVTPSFSTGQVSLTPTPPVSRAIVIGQSAPVIRSLQLGTTTANSFELLVTGYSTARSITGINLQFTPAAGANLQTTTLALAADTAFTSWYQSTASVAAGSQFTASITIQVSGSIGDVQSVSATASNTLGVSNAANVSLR